MGDGFYASPGAMTTLADEPGLMAGLPDDAGGLCGVARGLIVHEFAADTYGVTDTAVRVEEVETRAARDIVAGIARLDPRPLAEAREPGRRMIGNCRQFSVLTCALLRRAGIPARARAGFAGYFGEGWADHWIVERLHEGRWIRTDPQIDAVFTEMLGIDFDPAALHKVELLPWDVWGLMDTGPGAAEGDRSALLDEVAAAVTAGTPDDRLRLYEHADLRVPAKVWSHRFQRDVPLETV